MKKPVLGKGLSALISDLPSDISEKNVVTELLLKDIIVNKEQPRKYFDQEALEELAQSIKNNGVIQPIVVNPVGDKYQIIVGERRYRASLLANKETVPAIVKKSSENEIFTWALLENIQREDLNALEIATAYAELMEKLRLTQEALAETVGKSRSSITNTLRLLKLPESIKTSLLEGKITEGHARTIVSLTHIDEQLALRDKIIENEWTVREAEQYLKTIKNKTVSNKTSVVSENQDSLNPHLKHIESHLSSLLNIKVKVLSKDGKKGKIELYYANGKEFDSLQKILSSLSDTKIWI